MGSLAIVDLILYSVGEQAGLHAGAEKFLKIYITYNLHFIYIAAYSYIEIIILCTYMLNNIVHIWISRPWNSISIDSQHSSRSKQPVAFTVELTRVQPVHGLGNCDEVDSTIPLEVQLVGQTHTVGHVRVTRTGFAGFIELGFANIHSNHRSEMIAQRKGTDSCTATYVQGGTKFRRPLTSRLVESIVQI